MERQSMQIQYFPMAYFIVVSSSACCFRQGIFKSNLPYSLSRYKARYKPSDLLCPVTYDWITLDRCTPLLDANKFAKLRTEATSAKCDGNETVVSSEDDVGKTLVLYQGILIRTNF